MSVGRETLPPFPINGGIMEQTRWYEEVRRRSKEQTVFNLQTIRESGSGNRTQNLLSSSWLNPSAADEFELTTLNATHRNYLGVTRGTDQIGLLSEMGLAPGDTISASVEVHATGGQVGRVQLIFSHDPFENVDDPTDIVLGTENGIRVDKDTEGVGLREERAAGVTAPRLFKEFAVSTLENIRIPDLATHVQFNAISDSTSTAGTITWRRAMLNAGATALPYTAPPLRPDRETDMVGADTYLELTGTAAADLVTIPHNALWDIAASTAMSVEIEYITFVNTAFGQLIDALSPGEGWRLTNVGTNDDFGFSAIHTDGTESLSFDREDQILFKRRHRAFSRSTSGVMKMYVDGRLSDDTYTNNNAASGTTAPVVGADFVGGIYYVRIWDVERTQKQLIDERHTIFPDSTTNLRGDWQFNEASGTVVKNHGDVANTDGVISGTGFKWRGPAVGALPDLTNLPIETSIAAGDFIPMEDITDNLSGKITFSDFESSLTAASLTTAGVVELATVAETNTGTDATRAVTPDGLDGWTGSAQIVTVGTLSAGDVTTQVSSSSDSLAGRVELATDAETVTGTDTARATTPANITAKMSAPGPIGDTTPSTGAFTTLDASGLVTAATQVVVGAAAAEALGGLTSASQTLGTSFNDSALTLARWSADGGAGALAFGKSRNATIGSFAIVEDNDVVGRIRGFADDGNNLGTEIGSVDLEIDDASPAVNSIGGAIVFKTAPGTGADDIAEVGRFRADGHLELSNGLQIGGTGAANLLDDYEEGTFTPTLQDSSKSDAESQTYTTNDGEYTKIGNVVFFQMRIILSSLGSLTGSDDAFIGNLPFTSDTAARRPSVYVGNGAGLAITGGQTVAGFIVPNTNGIVLTLWDDAVGTTFLSVDEVSANGNLMINGHYQVA